MATGVVFQRHAHLVVVAFFDLPDTLEEGVAFGSALFLLLDGPRILAVRGHVRVVDLVKGGREGGKEGEKITLRKKPLGGQEREGGQRQEKVPWVEKGDRRPAHTTWTNKRTRARAQY
jgi:hypothetical protein